MKELSKEKAKYLATVDGVDHVALVALDPEDSHEIVAIVRYDREPEDEKAEYAALVEDRWQEHGVGIALTRELEQPQRPGVHLETLYTGPRSANRCDR